MIGPSLRLVNCDSLIWARRIFIRPILKWPMEIRDFALKRALEGVRLSFKS